MSATKRICLLAVLTATLTGGKMAIPFPNIEIVTLLFVVYALVFGWRNTIIVSIAFVLIEILIFGFFIWWVLLYAVHWPLLVTAVAFLPRKREKGRIVAAIVIGIVLTMLFGVLSTFIEVVFLMDAIGSGMFWELFGFRYMGGTGFFAAHIIGNTIILIRIVPVLYRVLKKTEFLKLMQEKKKKTNDAKNPKFSTDICHTELQEEI